jgi:hypothetical protein
MRGVQKKINKTVHIKLSLHHFVASYIVILLKTVNSLGIFVLLFLSVYINTNYGEEENQDCSDL